MNATQTGFSSGIRRIRGVALALMLLALLASGAAGYLIRAVTSSTTVTAPHSVTASPSSVSSNPVGDRWWQDAVAAGSQEAASNPVGDGWWADAPVASSQSTGGNLVGDRWWDDER